MSSNLSYIENVPIVVVFSHCCLLLIFIIACLHFHITGICVIFRSAERIFRSAEHIFRSAEHVVSSAEHVFSSAEYKSNTEYTKYKTGFHANIYTIF